MIPHVEKIRLDKQTAYFTVISAVIILALLSLLVATDADSSA